MMRKKLLLIIMALVLLVTAVSCDDVIRARNAKAYILSVGLDYENTATLAQLPGSINDATEVAFCLRENYAEKGIESDLRVMLGYTENADYYDDYPTADKVMEALEAINPTVDDLVVFYFSGHADYQTDETSDRYGEVFLACALTTSAQYTELYVEDIYECLEKKGCACAVILDTCYSGYLTDFGDKIQTFEEAFQAVTGDNGIRNISVLASSQKDEQSKSATGNVMENHGIFTYFLLEQLGWVHSTESKVSYGDMAYPVQGYLDTDNLIEYMSTTNLYGYILDEWSQQWLPSINNTSYDILIIPYVNKPDAQYIPYETEDEGVTIKFKVIKPISGKLVISAHEEGSPTWKLTYVNDEDAQKPSYFIWTCDGEFMTSEGEWGEGYGAMNQTITYTMTHYGRCTITVLAIGKGTSGSASNFFGATTGTSASITLDYNYTDPSSGGSDD